MSTIEKQSLLINNGVERYDNIIKSAKDERLYRGLKLQNGLKALLISDSTTDISAASLAVNVGEFPLFNCFDVSDQISA